MRREMTQGNLIRQLVYFSVPLVLSGLLQQLYSWADAFIVGNVEGEGALAAIGVTNAGTGLFLKAITGFTSGVSVLAAQYYGRGDRQVQGTILSTFTLALGAVFTALAAAGALWAGEILQALETPADIFGTARNYFCIVLAGIPFLSVYNVYAAVLRGMGDSKSPFYSVLISSLGNILLDLLLVGGLGWGAEGAAAATVLSQAAMTVFIVAYAARRYEMLRPRLGSPAFSTGILRAGSRLSLPITLQAMAASLGNLLLQNFMNGFGTATVAAITTAYRIDSVIMLPVYNLGTGISTVAAQNFGAGNYRRARQCLYIGTLLTAAIAAGLTVFVLLLGGSLIAMFGVSAQAVQIGRSFFGCIAWFYVVFGAGMAVRSYIIGAGKALFSGISSILALGVRIGLSYALLPVFGNMVIAYAEAFSWCFQLALFALYLLPLHRQLRDREAAS